MKKNYLNILLVLIFINLLNGIINAQCISPTFPTIGSNTTTICAGGSVTFTRTNTMSIGGFGGFEWIYNTSFAPSCASGTFFSSLSNPAPNNITWSFPTPGVYTVRLRAVAFSGPCSSFFPSGYCSFSPITITVLGAPSITMGSSTRLFCPGSATSIIATVSSGTTFSWTKNGTTVSGATTPTINFASPTLLDAGIYRCISTSACGTATSSPVTFTTLANENIVGAAASITNTTKGYQVTNFASQGVTYNWTLPSGGTITAGASTHSATVNWGSIPGTYTVSVLKTIGACSVTDTKTISIQTCSNTPYTPGAIGLDFAPKICEGQSVDLYPYASGTFSWSTGEIGGGITATPSVTTTYSVQAFDGIGCLQSGTVQVQVQPSPQFTISASNSTICANQSSTLSITGINYTAFSITGGSTVVSPSITSTYTVTAFASSPIYCSLDKLFTIYVNTCVGVKEYTNLKYELFPNPAENFINIVGVENASYNILNILGETILSGKITDEINQIKIDSLKNGIYFIHLNNESINTVNRFIKE